MDFIYFHFWYIHDYNLWSYIWNLVYACVCVCVYVHLYFTVLMEFQFFWKDVVIRVRWGLPSAEQTRSADMYSCHEVAQFNTFQAANYLAIYNGYST